MAAPRRTPGDGHRSPYGMDGEVSGGQLLKNLVTPIRWGIGGITKTVRGLLGSPVEDAENAQNTNATSRQHTTAQPAQATGEREQRAGSQSGLLDELRRRQGQSGLTREEANAVISLLQRGDEKAHEGAGADLNRAATGLPQAAGAADLAATSSGAAAEETPFTGIRQYLQQTNAERKRALLSLPNARGVSKTSKMGWGGSRGGIADASQADGTSMYETRQQSQRTSLLAASIGGAGFRRPAGFGSARRGAGGLGASGSPPTASGAGMDWGYQSMMSAGSKRSRDAAEFDAHERERGRSTMPRLSGPPTSMPPHAFHAHGETPGFIMGPKATPAGPSPVAKEPATAAVTTDTARRILQTLDRLAGQKTSPETRGTAASPLPKPLNLSSSLNRAAAPTSALHGFRGIQRATPAKSLDDADKRSPAPSIASHSKSKMRAVPSAPRPSPLQFKPDVLSAKDTGTASASTAMEDNKTANAPVVSTYQSPFSDRAPLQKSAPPLFATGTPDTQAAHPVTMEPEAEEEALPTFTFGEPSPVAAPAATFNPSAKIDSELPSYAFGGDEHNSLPVNDLPIYSFCDGDDGGIDVVKFGSAAGHDNENVDKSFTFGESSSNSAAMPAAHKSGVSTFGAEARTAAAQNLGASMSTPATFEANDADKCAEAKPAKEDAPKKVNLWSSDFLKQNQEHQKKVQDAIDEEEKKASAPAPSPLTGSASPSPFSFGTSGSVPSTAASSGSAFTFGTNPPAATVAAPSFGFGNGSSRDGAEKSKDDIPASTAAPFTFGVSAIATDADKRAEAKPAKEDAPKKVNLWSSDFLKQNQEHQKKVQDAIDEEEKKASAPAPSPLTGSASSSPFSFATSGLTSTTDAAAKPAAISAPFTFGAPSTTPSTLNATAAPFTFGVKSTTPASEAATMEPAVTKEMAKPEVSFGTSFPTQIASVKDTSSSKPDAPTSTGAAFTFGTATDSAPKKSGSGVTVPNTVDSGSLAASDAPASSAAPFTFGKPAPDPGSTLLTGSEPKDAPSPSGGAAFTFGAPSSTAPSSTPALTFGGASSVPAFGAGASSSAPTFGTGASAPASTPAFGAGTASTPAFGTGTSSSAPAFGASASSTPAFGSSTPLPTFGGDASKAAPVLSSAGFGAAAAAPDSSGFGGFGASSSQAAPASAAGAFTFGVSASTVASSSPASTPFGTPAPTPGFGGGSTPSFGAAAANPFGGGGDTSNSGPASSAFGGFGGNAPSTTFGASGDGSGFGGSGAPPPLNTPSLFVGGSAGPAPAAGGGFGAAPFGGATGAPPVAFGAAPGAGGFGAPGIGGMPMGGGGMSMGAGSAGAPPGGRKKRVARRPPKRN
mmetsp:Transcript_12781/g.54859  ORF Transcript_12781/g.54859 Transcript_12781/m.54859 type:complete len:1341 (-) Transcript_12781:53-4075(-)